MTQPTTLSPGTIVDVTATNYTVNGRYRVVRPMANTADYYLSRDLTGTAGDDWDLIAHVSTCHVVIPGGLSPAQTFESVLTAQYADLFITQSETYAYVLARQTPAQLAAKITAGLATGDANHDGAGVQRTCKVLGIPHTRKAIRAYLNPTA